MTLKGTFHAFFFPSSLMRNKHISLCVEAVDNHVPLACPAFRHCKFRFMTWPLDDAGWLPISTITSFYRIGIVEIMVFNIINCCSWNDTDSGLIMICPHVGVLFPLSPQNWTKNDPKYILFCFNFSLTEIPHNLYRKCFCLLLSSSL